MNNAVVCLLVGFLFPIIFVTPTGHTMQAGAKEEAVKVSQLPAAVVQAVKTNCAGCSIHKAAREVENGVTIYDLEFKHRQGEMDVAEDGSVIDRETVVPLKDVPAAALDAIRRGALGGTIKQVAKDEVRAELKDGKIIKLDTPKYLYEAELEKGNQVAEIEVTAEGQVTEAPQWRRKGTKEN
jgi:uncharacterized membrane protein YkoI